MVWLASRNLRPSLPFPCARTVMRVNTRELRRWALACVSVIVIIKLSCNAPPRPSTLCSPEGAQKSRSRQSTVLNCLASVRCHLAERRQGVSDGTDRLHRIQAGRKSEGTNRVPAYSKCQREK